MKRLVLCLLLCGCGSDTTPSEGQGGELDAGRSDDGGKLARDANSDRDSDAGPSDDDEQVSDAGKDAGSQSGKDAGALDDRERCGFKTCPPDGISVVRMGKTPGGNFTIQRAGVIYVLGFSNSMSVHLIGKIDGDYVDLMVSAYNSLEVNHVVPPGTYKSGQNDVLVSGTLYREGDGAVCSDTGVAGSIELVIQKHVGPAGGVERGDDLELSGKIKITGSGWNLEAPFNIETLCDRFTDI